VTTVAISAGAALVAAVISTLGGIYVGRRSRDTTVHLATLQNELSETVLRRQLFLTVATRSLLIGERAVELRNGLASLRQQAEEERRREIRRREDRLDLACERFVESWMELAGWGIETIGLALLVEELSNALEASRLYVIVGDDVARRCLLLGAVDRVARSVSASSGEFAKSLGPPPA
jgi:hypothetical protein